MTSLTIHESEDGVVFAAKIVPGSSRTAICGLFDGMLRIKISAPPEKGKANQCLLEFLARQLGVKKNAVHLVSGQTSRVKRLHVSGISSATLLKKLNLNNE